MKTVALRHGNGAFGPVVCVHAVTGRTDVYRPLVDAMRWPGSIIGIEASGVNHDVEDLAVAYVGALDLRSPVRLLGWSFGGVVAVEMSRIINAEVAFVGVLDSRAPQPEMRTRQVDADTLARAFVQHHVLRRQLELRTTPASSDVAEVRAALRANGVEDALTDDDELATFMSLVRALFRHTPKPTSATLHLFEAKDEHPSHPRPPTLGWDSLAARVLHHSVAGTHFDLISPNRATELARAVDACLAGQCEQ